MRPLEAGAASVEGIAGSRERRKRALELIADARRRWQRHGKVHDAIMNADESLDDYEKEGRKDELGGVSASMSKL